MDIRNRLNRIRSAVFDGDTGPALSVDARLAEISSRLEALCQQANVSSSVTPEERWQLERFRLEQRLLGNWSGREREELVSRARAILSKLRPMKAIGYEKTRVGSDNDGGYVLIDDFQRVKLALSFGVEHNAQWDLQMAERGIPVRQYDHSINQPPVIHPLIHWEKKAIAATASESTASISSILRAFDGASPAPNALLKIDIEHAEWEVFDATPEQDLQAFTQIAGEFHGFDYLADRERLAVVERVVEKLTRRFAVVHVHANNYCGMTNYFGLTVPYVLEFTFANRSVYQFEESDEMWPGALDAPCDPSKPDLWLGQFRY